MLVDLLSSLLRSVYIKEKHLFCLTCSFVHLYSCYSLVSKEYNKCLPSVMSGLLLVTIYPSTSGLCDECVLKHRCGTSEQKLTCTHYQDTPTPWPRSDAKLQSHKSSLVNWFNSSPWIWATSICLTLYSYSPDSLVSSRVAVSFVVLTAGWQLINWLIAGSHDSTIRLWDLIAGKTRATLTNHKKSVRTLVLHPRQ